MNLLRQWPVLQALLVPALAPADRSDPLVVWNLGCLDDALAVALACLQSLPSRSGGEVGEVSVFHSGPAPAWEPIEWSHADVSALDRSRWVSPPTDLRRRWRPHPELLGRVRLEEPSGVVDLITAPSDRATVPWQPPLERLRVGGHVLAARPMAAGDMGGNHLRRVDDEGRLYRKVGGPTEPAGAQPPGPEVRTLARHDEHARLVAAYMNLARSLARRFQHRGERYDDLEQVAAMALVKAAGRYRPERGPFGPYATTSIVGELKRHFRDKVRMVRVPRSLQELYLEVRAARDELGLTLGSSPTIGQIAEYLGTDEDTVLAAMEAAGNSWPTSLDAPNRESGQPETDIPVTDSGFEAVLDHRVLCHAAARLSPSEQLVVRRVYFDGCTQAQVAGELGVSQMQVSRIMARSIAQMRQSFDTG